MTTAKFYDIATALGHVAAEVLAQKDGLFVHRLLDDDGESFHDDKFVVSAISCGYRATRGYWFRSVETAVSYMHAIAPLTDWRAMMPDTPIHPDLRTAVRRILREHEPAGQDDEDAAIPITDTGWTYGVSSTEPRQ
jgi:hypothetical protein